MVILKILVLKILVMLSLVYLVYLVYKGANMFRLWKKRIYLILFVVSVTLLLAGCGGPAGEDSNADEMALLLEIQAELAELRAENTDLRESNERLLQNLEELARQDDGAADPGGSEDTIHANSTQNAPQNPPQDAPPAPNAPSAPNQPIVVEVHVTAPPEPSPTPSPTPAPVRLFGRWVVVEATRGGEPVDVPPEEWIDVNFLVNGTGAIRVGGDSRQFSWTGDTGATGRIDLTFTTGFFGDVEREAMTFRISDSRLYLTHSLFDELTTTILEKPD